MVNNKFSPLFTAFIVVVVIVFLYAGGLKADTLNFTAMQKINMTEVCLNGKLYVVTSTYDNVSTIQVMQKAINRNLMIPATCVRIQGKPTHFIMSGQE